jgi:hypothetical protein
MQLSRGVRNMPTPAPPEKKESRSTTFEPQKLIQHLSEKWHGKACPMCNSGPWAIGTEIFELREFHGGNFVLESSKILPVVNVTCTNCGNTILINAITAGLVNRGGQA